MADFGSPVAQNVNVNPTQGIQTISGLLNIKQQRLALETGQALKSSAESEALEKGVEATGKVEASGFLKNLDFFKHFGPDGTLDTNSVFQEPEFGKLSGPAKEAAANAVLGIKNNQIKNKSDLATLNGNVVSGASKLIGALANDPDVLEGNAKGFEKTNAQWDIVRSMYPDQGAAFAEKFQPHQTPENMKNPGDLARAVRSVQLMGEDVAQQQAQQNPNLGTTYDQNGNLIGTAQNRVTGAVTTPQQPGVQVGLGPTQTPEYQARLSQAGATGTGVGNIDVQRANTISTSQQPASASIKLTHRVDQLAHEVANSVAAQKITEGLHALGFSSVAAARTELQKDLGLLKGPVASRAGSDARAAELLEGYPTDTTPENTVHSAMDYIRGTMRQTISRGQLLKKHGVAGIAAADDELTRNTDPLMHEALSLKPGESKGFYKRNFSSPEEAQKFKNRVDALKKHTNFLEAGDE